jgi:uncharacterized protein (TIGR03118 family)
MKWHRRSNGGLAAACLFAAAGIAVAQDDNELATFAHPDRVNDYRVTILVSNEEDEAPVVDPLLVNAWGIAASDTGPWWVADNGTGHSTVYTGDGTKLGLEPVVPGFPTGTVHHDGSSGLLLAQDVPALFLFASEDGTFSAWNGGFNADAVVVHNEPAAIYKGLAINGDVLYSSDFAGCSVDTSTGNFFDGSFAEFDTPGGFKDDSIPAGFCPFGIQRIGGSIFVTYALKNGVDDVPGMGHGFVRQFDTDGNLVAKVASHGQLDSPWGLAMAPENFGRFSGCLLVGNFGNGRINSYCQNPAGEWHFAGSLRHHHHKISIDGLWGIGFGNGHLSGPMTTLYFAAGPDGETNGYYGKIEVEQP